MFFNNHFKAAKIFFAAFFIFGVVKSFGLGPSSHEKGFSTIHLRFDSAEAPVVIPQKMQVVLIYTPQRQIPYFNGRNESSGISGGSLPGVFGSSSKRWVPNEIKVNVLSSDLKLVGNKLSFSAKSELFGISKYRLSSFEFTSDTISRTFYFEDRSTQNSVFFGYSSLIKAGEAPSKLAAVFGSVDSEEISFSYFFDNQSLDHAFVDCDSTACRFKNKIFWADSAFTSVFNLVEFPDNSDKTDVALLQVKKGSSSGFFASPYSFKNCSVVGYSIRRAKQVRVECVNNNSSGYQKNSAKVDYYLFDEKLVTVRRYFSGGVGQTLSEQIYWVGSEVVRWDLDQDISGKTVRKWDIGSGSVRSLSPASYQGEAVKYLRGVGL